MQGSTRRPKKTKLRTFFLWFGRLVVPDSPGTPQFPPDSGTHNSSSPHVKTHCGGLDITDTAREAHSSFSPPPAEPRGNSTASTSAGAFREAHDFVIYNIQRDTSTAAQGMKALYERVIEGAEYDSSSRDPPPRCSPGTRVQLRSRIVTWFQDRHREKALLWLNGPAGVGKSAVIQTVAESLDKSKSLGATLFFSRLHDRRDPQQVFITIAFQLATRIPAYRTYITDRIALDPSLLWKGMGEQFRIFIAEPFGNRGIGKGEGPWGVLLDGLDECEGAVSEQSRVVQLVSEFVVESPGAPLVWAFASRPEPHIVATFNDEVVAPSCWLEYMPVDSTQACEDVKHYLDVSFKAMRKSFPHLSSKWPSNAQFLKLSNGALGLFVFATTAVCFIEDPHYAKPVSRLNLLLSVIDRLNIKITDDHPFAFLDELYTQILTSIPRSVWFTTKRILGFVICTESDFDTNGLSYPLLTLSCTLIGASIILDLDLDNAYSALHKLHSFLNIPVSTEAHKTRITFLHASFGDYLTDRARSKQFFIDRGESVDDITSSLFRLYLDKTLEIERVLADEESGWYVQLRLDVELSVYYITTGELRSRRGRGPLESQEDRLECLDALSRINPVEIYELDGFTGKAAMFLVDLWNRFQEELEITGLFKGVLLGELQVDHLDYTRNKPAFASKEHNAKWIADSSSKLRNITNELRKHQLSHPQELTMIYGSIPEERIAFFPGEFDTKSGYFCFPYPY